MNSTQREGVGLLFSIVLVLGILVWCVSMFAHSPPPFEDFPNATKRVNDLVESKQLDAHHVWLINLMCVASADNQRRQLKIGFWDQKGSHELGTDTPCNEDNVLMLVVRYPGGWQLFARKDHPNTLIDMTVKTVAQASGKQS